MKHNEIISDGTSTTVTFYPDNGNVKPIMSKEQAIIEGKLKVTTIYPNSITVSFLNFIVKLLACAGIGCALGIVIGLVSMFFDTTHDITTNDYLVSSIISGGMSIICFILAAFIRGFSVIIKSVSYLAYERGLRDHI